MPGYRPLLSQPFARKRARTAARPPRAAPRRARPRAGPAVRAEAVARRISAACDGAPMDQQGKAAVGEHALGLRRVLLGGLVCHSLFPQKWGLGPLGPKPPDDLLAGLAAPGLGIARQFLAAAHGVVQGRHL